MRVEPKSKMKNRPYGEMGLSRRNVDNNFFFNILTYVIVVLVLSTMFVFSLMVIIHTMG